MFSFLMSWFTVPGFLIGTLAAAIPFIIHLIYRRRAPKVWFPTLMFLLASARKTAHRRRLQELLLLALRSLALFLLAVGLAGFHLPGLGGGGGDVSMALVFDNSYSMAAQGPDGPLLQAAGEAARQMVRALGEGGSVALCFSHVVAPQAEGAEMGEQLSRDRERALEALREADVSYGHGSVSAAIERAERLLETSESPLRFVCVVSDLQAVGWAPLPPRAEQRGRETPLVVIDVGSAGFRNIAVTAVDLHGKGHAVGVPITLEAKVFNNFSQEQEASLRLVVDGREPVRRTVTVAAGGTASAAFPLVFDAPGPHSGWVEVATEDSLDADDRRWFALRINEQIPVLLVKESVAPIPLLDEAFYLVRALNPAITGATDVRSVVAPREMLRSELASADLAPYAAVFLLDLPRLTDVQWGVLAAYVQRGGTVVILPGAATDRDAWNRAADSVPGLEGGLLPARMGQPAGAPQAGPSGETHAFVKELDLSHPLMAPFKGLPRANFESIHLWRWHVLEPVSHRSASVLARLDNGDPFLVESRVGMGRVFLFCVGAGADWSNFPARQVYPPLFHEIVYSAVGATEQSLSVHPGAEVRIGVPDPAPEMELTDPLGNVRRNLTVGGFARHAYAPGIYRWRELSGAGREGLFVVNPIAEESDLTRLSHDEVQARLPGRRVFFASDADEAVRHIARLRKGVQLWTFVLFLVLAIALAECYMANRPAREEQGAPALAPTFPRARGAAPEAARSAR